MKLNRTALYTHYYGVPNSPYALSLAWGAYSHIDYVDFIFLAITDDPSPWKSFLKEVKKPSNIKIKYISVKNFHNALQFLDFNFETYFERGEVDPPRTGRDLCGLKPFLFLLDPENPHYSNVGWIDMDTILSKDGFQEEYISKIQQGSIGRSYKHGALALFDNSPSYRTFLNTDGSKSLCKWKQKTKYFRSWDDHGPDGFQESLEKFCFKSSLSLHGEDQTHYKFGIGALPDDESVFIFKEGSLNCTIPKRSEFQKNGALLCLDTFLKCPDYLNYAKENRLCFSKGVHIFGWTTRHNTCGYDFAKKHPTVNADGLEMWYCYKYEG